MRVLFVFPDIRRAGPRPASISYYEGVALLAAILDRAGHETSLLCYTRAPDRRRFLEEARAARPDLVAFSATSLQYKWVRLWSGWVREGLRLPSICGGVHATVAPDDVLAAESVDMICVGEGEGALLDVCAALAAGRGVGDVPNIWSREAGRVRRNPPRPLVADLDALPHPRWDLFEFSAESPAHLMLSRGCPFGCHFCVHLTLQRLYAGKGRYVRRRSVAGAIDYLRAFRRACPQVRAIDFDDQVFHLDPAWLAAFAPRYRQEVGLPFFCHGRLDALRERDADQLALAGCTLISFGLESGSERIRREVLGRAADLGRMEAAAHVCRRRGIAVHTTSMIGLPTETAADLLETIKLNARLGVRLASASYFYPFPGTATYERFARGHRLDDSVDTYFEPDPAQLSRMNSDDLHFFKAGFSRLVDLYRLSSRLGAGAERLLDLALLSPGLRRALARASALKRSLLREVAPRLPLLRSLLEAAARRRARLALRVTGGPRAPRPAASATGDS
jgi:anaerobic magnesium-protoporphyrin IX monomethyl ester cyclase